MSPLPRIANQPDELVTETDFTTLEQVMLSC
jgi:hypothetical protein